MRRAIIGALWGMIFYLLGHVIVGLIVGSPAVDAWRPLIALVAATLAVRGKLERVAAGHAELEGSE